MINIVTWSLKSDDFLFCCRNTICKRTWYWEDRAVMSVITYDREESVLRGQVPLLKFKVSFFNIQRRSKNSLHAESRNITEVVWKLIWENFVPFLGGFKAHQSIEIMRCITESFITKTGRNTQFRFKISFFALKHLFHLRWKLKLFCIKTFGQVLIFLFVCVLLFIHV